MLDKPSWLKREAKKREEIRKNDGPKGVTVQTPIPQRHA